MKHNVRCTKGMPIWMTIVWGIGVWGAFLVNLLYMYVLTDGGTVMGQQMAITNAMIALLLLFFSWYSYAMGKRRVLR